MDLRLLAPEKPYASVTADFSEPGICQNRKKPKSGRTMNNTDLQLSI